jgi:hypothetical protein
MQGHDRNEEMKTAEQWSKELYKHELGALEVSESEIARIQADALNHAAQIAGDTSTNEGLESENGHFNRGCFDVEEKLRVEAAKLSQETLSR